MGRPRAQGRGRLLRQAPDGVCGQRSTGLWAMMDSLVLSGSRVLVTGAAGFIGSHLVERLLSEGAQVVGVDSFEDYYPRALKEANLTGALADPRYTFVEADVHTLATEAGERRRDQARGAGPRLQPRLSSGRPGRGAGELGSELPRLRGEQRARHPARARGVPRVRGREGRLCQFVVRVRRQPYAAPARETPSAGRSRPTE